MGEKKVKYIHAFVCVSLYTHIHNLCLGLACSWSDWQKHLPFCSGAGWSVSSTLTLSTDWQLCIWRSCSQFVIKSGRTRTHCRRRASALMSGCCLALASCVCHYWRNLCIKVHLYFSLFSIFAKAEPLKLPSYVLFILHQWTGDLIIYFRFLLLAGSDEHDLFVSGSSAFS